MRALAIGRSARLDIDGILEESADRWGAVAADRYRRLLDLAFAELQADKEPPASKPSGVADLRLFALRFPARRLPRTHAVRSPPHVIAYRSSPTQVQIVRVLHDRMDLPRYLTTEAEQR